MSHIPPEIEQAPSGKVDGDKIASSQVRPLTEDGITYAVSRALREDTAGTIVGQDFFVTASDEAGAELWRTQYFSKEFEPGLETDVQEIYPVDFFIDGEVLVIKHEHSPAASGIFSVAKKDGRVESGL